MAENTILPIAAEQPFIQGLENQSRGTRFVDWSEEFTRSLWTGPERNSGDDQNNARVVPIAFENECDPVTENAGLPELNLDCFRVHAYEQERAEIRELANSTIQAVPRILSEAVQSNQAFGDIPLMLLSENTKKRLQDAILADEDIQDSLPWGWVGGTSYIGLVSELNHQLAYESLHGEEQRVWDYLKREGLNPFVVLGEDGRVRITVRLFE